MFNSTYKRSKQAINSREERKLKYVGIGSKISGLEILNNNNDK